MQIDLYVNKKFDVIKNAIESNRKSAILNLIDEIRGELNND